MTFLTRTPGITQREAREICDLHELITYSQRNGPVPIELYASIRGVKASCVESAERNARRLVARLKDLGFVVLAAGDSSNLTLDFSDRVLAVKVEEVIHVASSVYDSQGEPPEAEDEGVIPVLEIVNHHRMGFTLRGLMRRYGIRQDRLRLLLAANGCQPHRTGRLRIEEQRSAAVISRALDAKGQGANLPEIARILHCSVDTARAFIRRMKGSRRQRT